MRTTICHGTFSEHQVSCAAQQISSIRNGSHPVRKEDLVCLSSTIFATEIGPYVGHGEEDCKLTDSRLTDDFRIV